MDYTHYQSPFSTRYASEEMSSIFSLQNRFSTWRKIWVSLAEAEKELGLNISHTQIQELKDHVNTINFEKANQFEKECRHDVFAHILAYGEDCPKAKPIIHLGATSCLITDNADVIIMKDALKLIRKKTAFLMQVLANKAIETKSMPVLSYTHFQAAQPTTVGKRICMWLNDFFIDLKELDYRLKEISFLGLKGATGTQASFLELLKDKEKVKKLESLFAKKLSFANVFIISGQTYTRKQDSLVLDTLSNLAISAHKISTDLRLLAHEKEIEESFGKNQVGSSAMPYKQNPMLNERVCSLARYVLTLCENPKYTASLQWLERTLDDSANRRLCIPEAFLATDTILDLLINIVQNMKINPSVIQKNLSHELPFMATENILMASVNKGKDRQVIHERLKEHCLKAKNEGVNTDLLEEIANDKEISLNKAELNAIIANENFTGMAEDQVDEFLKDVIYPYLQK
ncbi:MAG: adenylosuccinate lyase [Chlamydiae bacterium]|nr:adenylosuccinate lyase [Chlamydiota bacterium]